MKVKPLSFIIDKRDRVVNGDEVMIQKAKEHLKRFDCTSFNVKPHIDNGLVVEGFMYV